MSTITKDELSEIQELIAGVSKLSPSLTAKPEVHDAMNDLQEIMVNLKKNKSISFSGDDEEEETSDEIPASIKGALIEKIAGAIITKVKAELGAHIIGSVKKLGEQKYRLVIQCTGTEYVKTPMKLALIIEGQDEYVAFSNAQGDNLKISLGGTGTSPDEIIEKIIAAFANPMYQVVSVPAVSVTVADKKGNSITLTSMDEIDRVLDEIEAARDAWLLKEEEAVKDGKAA